MDLRKTNLTNARLDEAVLTRANLDGATITNADFNGAFMGFTHLGTVELSSAKGLELVAHSGPSTMAVESIYRSSGEIPSKFLQGCGLEDWVIESRQLFHPDLSPAAVSDVLYRVFQLRSGHALQYYSCFISYSHQDKDFAKRLHDRLQARGIRCWLDEKQLLPGDPVYEQIDRGIRGWDKFLLCCSKHSLQPSSWVDKEILTALEKEDELARKRNEKVYALIPLNLDGYIFTDEWRSGYRAQIRGRLAADFTGWEQNDTKFQDQVDKVIRALRSDAASRENPPDSKL